MVYPTNVEGLMMEMDISPSNKYVAAFTNNNQIILLDTLTNEYKVTENPFKENLLGLVMLDDCLIVYRKILCRINIVNTFLSYNYRSIKGLFYEANLLVLSIGWFWIWR